ncbi:MAG: helix-turn-helix domain-containing protein [Oscillospiraceae bacterium]|nr:helix-turn-helix domain-containing protein [Oscillospiraceae bacterium]
MGTNNKTLRNRYPDFLSLDELRRICKISPKSARYLVEHGIIPAIDTGKQTWRCKISIDDVISYLRHRKKVGSMIPQGAVTNKHPIRNSGDARSRRSFSQIVKPEQKREIVEYFKYIFEGHDEILTTVDIAVMTGLDRSTVLKLVKSGHIKSIEDRPRSISFPRNICWSLSQHSGF